MMSFELIGASCGRRGHLGGGRISHNPHKNAYPSGGGRRIQTVKGDLLFRLPRRLTRRLRDRSYTQSVALWDPFNAKEPLPASFLSSPKPGHSWEKRTVITA